MQGKMMNGNDLGGNKTAGAVKQRNSSPHT